VRNHTLRGIIYPSAFVHIYIYIYNILLYLHVVCVSLFDRYAVVLNGHDVIREALVKRSADFAGREEVYSQKHVWNTKLQGKCN